jgi:hypothetical protein
MNEGQRQPLPPSYRHDYDSGQYVECKYTLEVQVSKAVHRRVAFLEKNKRYVDGTLQHFLVR